MRLNNSLKRDSSTKTFIIIAIVGFAFIFFVAGHIAWGMNVIDVKDPTGIFKAFTVSYQTDIFNFLKLNSYFPRVFGAMSLFYILLIALLWYESVKRRRDYNAQGRAAFENNIKAFNKKYNEPFGSTKSDSFENCIASEDVKISISDKYTQGNINFLIFGGAGSGKSQNIIIPNILQANASYVVTDPSGELLRATGNLLKMKGYKIKVLNVIDFEKSLHYNPFMYVRNSAGVQILVDAFMSTTETEGKTGGDAFWSDSVKLMLSIIFNYMLDFVPLKRRNIKTVLQLVDEIIQQKDESNDADYHSEFENRLLQVKQINPNHICLGLYNKFASGTGKSLKNVMMTFSTRFWAFSDENIMNMMGEDELEMDRIGDEKTAFFLQMSQATPTYNFIITLCYIQLFETLYNKGECEIKNGFYLMKKGTTRKDPSGKIIDNCLGWVKTKKEAEEKIADITAMLPENEKDDFYFKRGEERLAFPVRFFLDEFANIGQIPHFEHKISTMRKYNMSVVVVTQSLAQLREIYDKKTEIIVDNCRFIIFLSGQGTETLKYISERLDKTTKLTASTSRPEGGRGNTSTSYQSTASDLMQVSELGEMGGDYCVVIMGQNKPFYGKKYNPFKHPYFKYTPRGGGEAYVLLDRSEIDALKIDVHNSNMEERTNALTVERFTRDDDEYDRKSMHEKISYISLAKEFNEANFEKYFINQNRNCNEVIRKFEHMEKFVNLMLDDKLPPVKPVEIGDF